MNFSFGMPLPYRLYVQSQDNSYRPLAFSTNVTKLIFIRDVWQCISIETGDCKVLCCILQSRRIYCDTSMCMTDMLCL